MFKAFVLLSTAVLVSLAIAPPTPAPARLATGRLPPRRPGRAVDPADDLRLN